MDDDDFVGVVERRVLRVLEENKLVDRSGMHVHVRLACSELAR